MSLDDLFVSFQHLDRDTVLADWYWLIDPEMLPVVITAAGDAFVQDRRDGSVYFLDTVEGRLDEVAPSGIEFEQLLTEQQFIIDRFSVGLIAPLLKSGNMPGAGKVFSFKKPPFMGGEYDANNLETADIEAHFSSLGKLWSQARQLHDESEAGPEKTGGS